VKRLSSKNVFSCILNAVNEDAAVTLGFYVVALSRASCSYQLNLFHPLLLIVLT